jgi:membrane protease YdiL (CAAX protease family)
LASTTSQDFPTPWSPNAFRWGPALLVALGFAIVFAILNVAAGLFYALGHCSAFDPQIGPCIQHTLMSKSGLKYSIMTQTLIEAPMAVALVAVLPWLSKKTLRDLGFRGLSWRDVGIALLGALAMIVFVNGSATLLQAVTRTHEQELAVKVLLQLNDPTGRALAILTAAIVAPIAEELGFRVFVFNFIRTRTSFWPAAVISGLLFGLAHFSGSATLGSLATVLPLAVGGIILARVYVTTRNAYASMITHAVFNSVALAGLFLAPNLVK